MKYIILFTIVAFSLNRTHAQSTDLSTKELEQKTDALVQQYLDLDIFSGVVLIAEDGKPIYHKAFGMANRETGEKNTLNTLFNIGSMNKTFTSIVIHQLAQEGKLKLEDRLTQYLSGFEDANANKITIHHLLDHQSGFTDYHGPDYFDLPRSEKNIANTTHIIKQMPLEFEPGTDQMYSNAGYVLLGAIIEKITGKTYTENVRHRIVKPLGLKNTYLENTENLPHQSVGYMKTIFGETEDNRPFNNPPKPDGGFWSTTSDILQFYRAYFYGDQLLSKRAKADMEYFTFFEKLKDMDGKATGMAGGFNGANTVIFEIPSRHKSIVVFANMDEPVAEQLGSGILAILRGEVPKQPNLPAAQNIWQSWEKHGKKYVKEHFDDLTTNFHADDPKDLILNQIGYALLSHNHLDDAVAVFVLNTELFPQVANCWDSLGEAWLKKGDKKKALSYYQKALDIDPNLPSAKEMVEQLEK